MAQRGNQFGGGQPNMQQLMKQAQKMQEQLERAQAELAETEALKLLREQLGVRPVDED